MICLICRQGKIVDGITTISFELGEMKLVIVHIPARVCPRCGEAFVDESVAGLLLQAAKKMFQAGLIQDVIEYKTLF